MRNTLRATTLSVAALFVCTGVGLIVGGCKDSKRYYNSSTATSTGTPILVLRAQGSNTEIGTAYEVGKSTTTTFLAFLRGTDGNLTPLTVSELNSAQSPNPSTVGTFGGNLTFVSNSVNGNVDVTLTLGSNSAVTKTVQLRVVDTPNNTTTGTAGIVVKDGSTEVGSTYQVPKNSTTQFSLFNRDANGNMTALTVSEVNAAQNPNPSSIGTFGGSFTFVSNNTNGDVDVTLTLASNISISRTIRIQVVDNPNNTGGGVTGTVYTGIQINPENQQAFAAHTPRQVTALANSGSGLVTVAPETLRFWRVSPSALASHQCVVDAAGRFRAALAGGSFNVEVGDLGGTVTGGTTAERARALVMSNSLSLNTDNTPPAGLIAFAPAFMPAGTEYRPVVKLGTIEVTYDAKVNMTSSDPNVLMVYTDAAGKKAFRAVRDGIVTITVTHSDVKDPSDPQGQRLLPYEHRLRVTNADPFAQMFNSQFLVDTHENNAIYQDPTDGDTTRVNRAIWVRVVNLGKCASVSTLNASDHPTLLDWTGDLAGTTAPVFDSIYIGHEDGITYGIFKKVINNPTGNMTQVPHNSSGKSKSPIVNSEYTNESIWPFQRDLSQSHFYDEYNSGANKDLSTQIQFPGNLTPANLHQTQFVRFDKS